MMLPGNGSRMYLLLPMARVVAGSNIVPKRNGVAQGVGLAPGLQRDQVGKIGIAAGALGGGRHALNP